MAVETWLYALCFLVILVYLVFDTLIVGKGGRETRIRSALYQTMVWVGIAFGFGLLVYHLMSPAQAVDFYTAYLMEWSLSIDNIFVFILVLAYFKVDERFQHKVLMLGIIGAMVLRGVFIAAGAFLVGNFHWVLYIFGVILIVSGVKMIFTDSQAEFKPGIVYRFLTRHLRVTHDTGDGRFTTRKNGKLYFTQLFVVLILIDTVDVVFALDSIPAVFAITQDPFIVYTSNVFAIIGLRALFFLLKGMVKRFRYLQQGISYILIFIGVKMLFELFDYHLPNTFSLWTILSVLGFSVLLSWLYKTGPKE